MSTEISYKDTNELRELIAYHHDREMGYGWSEYTTEDDPHRYFLLITRNKRGEELTDFHWEINQEGINWLISKGVQPVTI